MYRLDRYGDAQLFDRGFDASNGPAFSPEGETLYLNDTIRRVTYAYDVAADGEMGARRIFLTFGDGYGFPDGMTCGAEGSIWIAFFGQPMLRRFAPDATLNEAIALPVS